VFHKIPELEQALRHMIPEDQWQLILDIAYGKTEMDSILLNYYPKNQDNI